MEMFGHTRIVIQFSNTAKNQQVVLTIWGRAILVKEPEGILLSSQKKEHNAANVKLDAFLTTIIRVRGTTRPPIPCIRTFTANLQFSRCIADSFAFAFLWISFSELVSFFVGFRKGFFTGLKCSKSQSQVFKYITLYVFGLLPTFGRLVLFSLALIISLEMLRFSTSKAFWMTDFR